jgi:multiple sugar transport system permease protein
MTTEALTRPVKAARPPGTGRRRRRQWGQAASQAFLIVSCVLWLLPIAFALYVAVRPYSETRKYGYVSLPHHLTFQNFSDAWTQSDMLHFFWNSVLITVPSVIVVLALASGVAFVLSKIDVKVNIGLLILFTAGNLLPQQVIITPLYRMYLKISLPHFVSDSGLMYNSIFGLVAINVAFQLGFCVFVLSNYMRAVPDEMYEAALVDGASLWTRFWRLTLPLCRPALAALGIFTFSYVWDDFFWPLIILTNSDLYTMPLGLTLFVVQNRTAWDYVMAGSVIVTIPVIIVFLLFQRHFIRGIAITGMK